MDANEAYKLHQLQEELRVKLLKAFRKNANLRTTKLDLEKKLDRITAKLKERDGATEILQDSRYAKVAIKDSRPWLKEIEKEVEADTKAAKRRVKVREKTGTKATRKTFTPVERMDLTTRILNEFPGEEVSLKDFQEQLRKAYPSLNAGLFLKKLNLPATAVKDKVPGSRRAGKILVKKQIIGKMKLEQV